MKILKFWAPWCVLKLNIKGAESQMQASRGVDRCFEIYACNKVIAWLEKQNEKINPYSGMSFEYNGHIWGMCARDNGVDILLDKQLFKHLEQQDEQTYIEIAESEDERIRKWIITQLEDMSGSTNIDRENKIVEAIDWLEKQNKNIVDCQQNHQDVKYPNGGIVMEDFNDGEGFYKLYLDYLNKKQVEEVEEMVRTWSKESKTSNI